MSRRDEYGESAAWQAPEGYQRDGYPPRSTYRRVDYEQDTYRHSPGPGTGSSGRHARPSGEPRRFGGAEGNERLTVMTGTLLLLLLAAEGVTILRLGRLLTVHFFLGMLLLGPVALKAGSVLYRFFRYYTGSAPYRRKGPPAPLLRLLGPVLMMLTVCVFGTGVMLAVVGPAGREPWLFYHKVTFILWFGAMAIHVLAYVPRLPRLLYAEARGATIAADDGRGRAANGRPYAQTAAQATRILGGRGVRLSLLMGSLAAGLVIALLTVHLARGW